MLKSSSSRQVGLEAEPVMSDAFATTFLATTFLAPSTNLPVAPCVLLDPTASTPLPPVMPASRKALTLHSSNAALPAPVSIDAAICTLDVSAHPSILTRLIALSPHSVLLTMRLVSRKSKLHADDALYRHVVLLEWGSLQYRSNPTPLFTLSSLLGAPLPGKPLEPGNRGWRLRLAQTEVLDSVVRRPYYTWEAIVGLGKPRVLRRLVSGGLWRAPANIAAVDLVVLSPSSLQSRLGQDLCTAVLGAPGRHILNIWVDPAFAGGGFQTGSGGVKMGDAVLVFKVLAGGMKAHLDNPVDDEPVEQRNMNLTTTETLFDSLARVLLAGYSSVTLVGLHEMPRRLVGLPESMTGDGEGEMKKRLTNIVAERIHFNAARGIPSRKSAREIAQDVTVLSHREYRARVGRERYDIETWSEAPSGWWWEWGEG